MRALVTGANGQVGRELVQRGRAQGIEVVGLDRTSLDITNAARVAEVVSGGGWDVVVNAAAFTDVDGAESQSDAAFSVNRDGAGALAAACSQAGLPLVHLSTDYVFDGGKGQPYTETDPVRPLNIYGASKAAGEDLVRENNPRHVILRSSWIFGAHGANFVKTMLRLSAGGAPIRVVDDQWGCPTAAEDLARVVWDIAVTVVAGNFAEWGTFHYCGAGAISWYGFAQEVLRMAEGSGRAASARLLPIPSAQWPSAARRPNNTVLDCTRIAECFAVEQEPWVEGLREVLLAMAVENRAEDSSPQPLPQETRG
ncbi:MAG: dTDP-4-dehydrorhamnose reductase [Deferrisomatales bacterium]|nr:dTDP-4-dehydrorhamnose reductase [Deferrisomatales bacterium]